MLKLILWIIILFVIYRLIRILILYKIENSVSKLCPNDFLFTQGSDFFSIHRLRGSGEMFSIDSENIKLNIHILSLFGISNRPFLSFSFSKLQVHLHKIPEIKKAEDHESFESWIKQRLFLLIVAFLLRKAEVDLNEFRVVFDDKELSIGNICLMFKRTQKLFSVFFSIQSLLIKSSNPVLNMPSFQLTSTIPGQSFKHVFTSLLSNFLFTIPNFQVHLDTNILNFSLSTVKCAVPYDPQSECSFEIIPFEIILPKINLTSKRLGFAINSITVQYGVFICGQMNLTRNFNNVFSVPSIRLKNGSLTIPNLNASLTTPLIQDIMAIKNIFLKMRTRDIEPKKIVLPIKVVVNHVEITIELSDDHKYFLRMDTAWLNESTVFIKSTEVKALFVDKILKIMNMKKVNVLINNQIDFEAKIKMIEGFVPSQYAVNEYLAVSSSIIRYLLVLYRGPLFVINHNEPPTPLRVHLTVSLFRASLKNSHLSDEISKSVEAKRIAMEGLQLRRSKAMQIISASQPFAVNLDEFEKISRKLLFSHYKDIVNSISDTQDLLIGEFSDLSIFFDGFDIHNRQMAFENIFKVVKNTKAEEIGDLDCGKVVIKCNQMKFSISKYGHVATINGFNVAGSAFIIDQKVNFTSQVFFYEITCDNHSESYYIPVISSPPVYLGIFDLSIESFYVHASPFLYEFLQDFNKIISDISSESTFYKKLCTIDNYRSRYRVIGSMLIKQLDIGVNHITKPFDPNDDLLVGCPNMILSFDGNVFDISLDSLTISINESGKIQRFIKIPKIITSFKFISVNKFNSSPDAPLFVNTNSSLVLDPEYDPYSHIRTDMFSCDLNINLNVTGESAVINFDLIDSIIDFLGNTNSINGFIIPPEFMQLSIPMPQLSTCSLGVNFPPLLFSFFSNEFSVYITNKSLSMSFLNDNHPIISFSANKLDIICSHFNNQLGVLTIPSIELSTNEGDFNISIPSIRADLNPLLLKQIMVFILGISEKEPVEQQKTKSVNVTPKPFEIGKASVSIQSFELQLIIEDYSFPPSLKLVDTQVTFKEQQMKNYISFNSKSILFLTRYNDLHPLISISTIQTRIIMDDKAIDLQVAVDGPSAFHVCPDDFNIIIPQLKLLLPDAMRLGRNSPSDNPPNLELKADFSNSVHLCFLRHDDTSLATIKAFGIIFHHSLTNKTAEQTKIQLKRFELIDETTQDDFHQALAPASQQEPLFSIEYQLLHSAAKCPVYQLINAKMQPLVIRVSKFFIEEMIKFFPSTIDFNVFDLEASESEKPGEIISQSVDLAVNEDEQVIGLYRQVIIAPLNVVMSYRGDSIIKELLSRQFDYQGLELLDTFGTREQLKELVKSKIRWAIIKSLPKIIFKTKQDAKNKDM